MAIPWVPIGIMALSQQLSGKRGGRQQGVIPSLLSDEGEEGEPADWMMKLLPILGGLGGIMSMAGGGRQKKQPTTLFGPTEQAGGFNLLDFLSTLSGALQAGQQTQAQVQSFIDLLGGEGGEM